MAATGTTNRVDPLTLFNYTKLLTMKRSQIQLFKFYDYPVKQHYQIAIFSALLLHSNHVEIKSH